MPRQIAGREVCDLCQCKLSATASGVNMCVTKTQEVYYVETNRHRTSHAPQVMEDMALRHRPVGAGDKSP
jgi:hypothetical protein